MTQKKWIAENFKGYPQFKGCKIWAFEKEDNVFYVPEGTKGIAKEEFTSITDAIQYLVDNLK